MNNHQIAVYRFDNNFALELALDHYLQSHLDLICDWIGFYRAHRADQADSRLAGAAVQESGAAGPALIDRKPMQQSVIVRVAV